MNEFTKNLNYSVVASDRATAFPNVNNAELYDVRRSRPRRGRRTPLLPHLEPKAGGILHSLLPVTQR